LRALTLKGLAADLVIVFVIAMVKIEDFVRVLDHTELSLAVEEEAAHS